MTDETHTGQAVDINKIEVPVFEIANQDTFNINNNDKITLSINTRDNVDVVTSVFNCVICDDIAIDPHESECCCCIACHQCYLKIPKNDKQRIKCPYCSKEEAVFSESKVMRRIIDSIKVKCGVHECGKQLEREFLFKHLTTSHKEEELDEASKKFISKNQKPDDQVISGEPVERIFNDIHRHFLDLKIGFEGSCDGKSFLRTLGECKKKIQKTDYFYYCDSCNLWFCLACITRRVDFYYTKFHNHALEFVFIDKAWSCNGTKNKEGCRSSSHINYENEKRKRYRCSTCDYDLCGNCLDYYYKY